MLTYAAILEGGEPQDLLVLLGQLVAQLLKLLHLFQQLG
jgi:hypothetical protein